MSLNPILLYSAHEKITPGQLKNGEGLFGLEDGLDTEVLKVENCMRDNQIGGVVLGGSDYHYKFNLIKSKPYIVYYKGNLDILNRPILGIVGPRVMSSYATEVLQALFEKLTDYNVITVSGLADGVDTLCHELSIEKSIPTIAVLGGGLDIYLKSNKNPLLQKIVANGGLILSEFKLFKNPDTYTFPQRNRIIAGLCDVLFLPEAGIKSGSLITADFALQMHKPIYGTPNSIFSQSSEGLNHRVADGKIKLINDFDVFLDTYFEKKSDSFASGGHKEILRDERNFSEKEKKILHILFAQNDVSLAELMMQSGMEMGELLTALTMLEMDGYVVQSGPGLYRKI